jgi:DNA modification methylase
MARASQLDTANAITAISIAKSSFMNSSLFLEEENKFQILEGDAADRLKEIPSGTVDCIFTSPDPMRTNADLYKIIEILGIVVKRVLKPTGSMWVHMEDSFNKEGSLMRWPAKFTMDMIYEYDWILRGERIWHAPVADQNYYNEGRVIDNNRLILDHSYCFHFTNARYGYYNSFDDFGGQPCSIFTERQRTLQADEYATAFSMELVKQCLLMSCPMGGTVLDPFLGSGTTGAVALSMKDKAYKFIGIENDTKKVIHTSERLNKIVNIV